jgi:hypothetical protein
MTNKTAKHITTPQRVEMLDAYITRLEKAWEKDKDNDIASPTARKELYNAVRTTLDGLFTACNDITSNDGYSSFDYGTDKQMPYAVQDKFAYASAGIVLGATLIEAISYFVGLQLQSMMECEAEKSIDESILAAKTKPNEDISLMSYSLIMIGMRDAFVTEVGNKTIKSIYGAVNQGCKYGFNDADRCALQSLEEQAEAIKNKKRH